MTRLLKRLLWDWLRLRLRWNRWKFWWCLRNIDDNNLTADIVSKLDDIDALMGDYKREEDDE